MSKTVVLSLVIISSLVSCSKGWDEDESAAFWEMCNEVAAAAAIDANLSGACACVRDQHAKVKYPAGLKEVKDKMSTEELLGLVKDCSSK